MGDARAVAIGLVGLAVFGIGATWGAFRAVRDPSSKLGKLARRMHGTLNIIEIRGHAHSPRLWMWLSLLPRVLHQLASLAMHVPVWIAEIVVGVLEEYASPLKPLWSGDHHGVYPEIAGGPRPSDHKLTATEATETFGDHRRDVSARVRSYDDWAVSPHVSHNWAVPCGSELVPVGFVIAIPLTQSAYARMLHGQTSSFALSTGTRDIYTQSDPNYVMVQGVVAPPRRRKAVFARFVVAENGTGTRDEIKKRFRERMVDGLAAAIFAQLSGLCPTWRDTRPVLLVNCCEAWLSDVLKGWGLVHQLTGSDGIEYWLLDLQRSKTLRGRDAAAKPLSQEAESLIRHIIKMFPEPPEPPPPSLPTVTVPKGKGPVAGPNLRIA